MINYRCIKKNGSRPKKLKEKHPPISLLLFKIVLDDRRQWRTQERLAQAQTSSEKIFFFFLLSEAMLVL